MSSNVLAFWQLLEQNPTLREQARLALDLPSRECGAAYLAGMAGGLGLAFSGREYLDSVEGFGQVARTSIGPVRMAQGAALPDGVYSESFFLPNGLVRR